MDGLKTWCRIVSVDDDAVLFYQDYDSDQKKHVIHAIIKGKGVQLDMTLLAPGPFTQEQFDAYACAGIAQSLLNKAKDLGLDRLFSEEDSPCLH